MLTQAALEEEITQGGKARAEKMMSNNEEHGRAHNNPYAQSVFRRFVLPLARVIDDDLHGKAGPGVRKAHVALLSPIDPEAVAYIAVRNILGMLLSGDDIKGNAMLHAIGSSVYHEYMLAHFEHVEPALFHQLVNDLDRRRSNDERHRMTVFKMQARVHGISWNEWNVGAKEQVGAYLVDQLQTLGMLDVEKIQRRVGRGFRSDTIITLTDDIMALIEGVKEFISETTPYYLPCVEPPRDWVSVSDGGWHTPAMRRIMPHAVSVRKGDVSDFGGLDLSGVLAGINVLQKVRWRVNTRVLEAVREVARHFDMEEILSQAEQPRPQRPEFLDSGIAKEQMDNQQLHEFIGWKRAMAEWHTDKKLRGTKYGRFYTATRVADKLKDHEAIYFVYFADFRGRLYAQTTGINPQGSDLQKALLEFADGKPIDSTDAELWFLVHGANKFGFDKAPLQARAAWVRERKDMLCRMADDPISFNEWQNADKPLQFLAWVFEYAEWVRNPKDFSSRIPVAMDGSCNGLQNFSALLLDEIGGKATNLVPAALPNDVYQMVADHATVLLEKLPEDELGYRTKWLTHKLSRSLVKRSVMTLPYGSTRFSCADFIVDDYLKKGKAPEFAKEEYNRAARYLSFVVWEAIGHVVVKAREAMVWLQQVASILIRNGEQDIRWITPTGFPVIQKYFEINEHRINTKLCGSTKIVCYSESDTPARAQHKNGIAPNFVHSLDASHMVLTALAASRAGVTSLAMIHDDYGTHAADAALLYSAIRSVFVDMYSNFTPLEDLRNRYAAYDLPPIPSKGNLNLEDVKLSEYFFS